MNASELGEDNTTILSCGFGFLPLNPTNISPAVCAAFVVKTTVNVCTCPITILFNILVLVAVKTKRQLRTKSNIALACLATTDLVVGLVVQPVQIITFSVLLKGGESPNVLCTFIDINKAISVICTFSSLYHLFLMSGERYLAIKHSFAYESGLVTEARIIITASCLAWIGPAIIHLVQYTFKTNRPFITAFVVFLILFVIIPVMAYFHVTIYNEVRRNEQQIIANQVSLEEKEKLLKNKRAFHTTVIVLLTIIFCYIPAFVWVVIVAAFKEKIPSNIGHVVFNVTTSFQVLNSFFNPLIYAVRVRHFRVAFIQLLSRKTLTQAEESERRIFGSKQIGVVANAEQEQI